MLTNMVITPASSLDIISRLKCLNFKHLMFVVVCGLILGCVSYETTKLLISALYCRIVPLLNEIKFDHLCNLSLFWKGTASCKSIISSQFIKQIRKNTIGPEYATFDTMSYLSWREILCPD